MTAVDKGDTSSQFTVSTVQRKKPEDINPREDDITSTSASANPRQKNITSASESVIPLQADNTGASANISETVSRNCFSRYRYC